MSFNYRFYFALAVFFTSAFMLTRVAMIITGIYKEPLLHLFEKYGGEERAFHIVPRILFWGGGLIYSLRGTFFGIFYIPSTWEGLGVFFIVCGYAYTRMIPRINQWTAALPSLPTWYEELCDRTTRDERRRLAYMWLRLPLRTRLLYNVNNRAFFMWADLVIMATLRTSE